jgi:tRNA (guanine37-N1)-methyltransferase
MWRATIFTLFPAMFPGALGLSLAGDALNRGLWACDAIDIRAFGLGRHRSVDDRPAGGGPGMVMRADVVAAALDAHLEAGDRRPRLVMSPRGRPLTQALVRAFAAGPGVSVLCGRFEGVDERVIGARNLLEVSIGDYVLSGGELAAMVLVDACVRLLPGVMGATASDREESFENNLLEYPQYTRPRVFEEHAIPEVLLGGDHRRIAAWRLAQATHLTRERRPDLMDRPSPGKVDAYSAQQETAMPDSDMPPFGTPFTCTAEDDHTLMVRHDAAQHWWRYVVAEKNGRLQLMHQAHGDGPSGPPNEALTLDAYDAATLEARRRGWVD